MSRKNYTDLTQTLNEMISYLSSQNFNTSPGDATTTLLGLDDLVKKLREFRLSQLPNDYAYERKNILLPLGLSHDLDEGETKALALSLAKLFHSITPLNEYLWDNCELNVEHNKALREKYDLLELMLGFLDSVRIAIITHSGLDETEAKSFSKLCDVENDNALDVNSVEESFLKINFPAAKHEAFTLEELDNPLSNVSEINFPDMNVKPYAYLYKKLEHHKNKWEKFSMYKETMHAYDSKWDSHDIDEQLKAEKTTLIEIITSWPTEINNGQAEIMHNIANLKDAKELANRVIDKLGLDAKLKDGFKSTDSAIADYEEALRKLNNTLDPLYQAHKAEVEKYYKHEEDELFKQLVGIRGVRNKYKNDVTIEPSQIRGKKGAINVLKHAKKIIGVEPYTNPTDIPDTKLIYVRGDDSHTLTAKKLLITAKARAKLNSAKTTDTNKKIQQYSGVMRMHVGTLQKHRSHAATVFIQGFFHFIKSVASLVPAALTCGTLVGVPTSFWTPPTKGKKFFNKLVTKEAARSHVTNNVLDIKPLHY